MKLELNLIDLEPAARGERLIEEYNALSPGQSVVLRTNDAAELLLALLQRKAPGGFDWHPLENRDQGWRIQVTRRADDTSPERQLQEFMSTDHRRLRKLADALVWATRDGDGVEVKRSHRHLNTGLLRHLDMEERVVFPVLVDKLGHPGGPAAMLLQQHARIRQLLGSVDALLAGTPQPEQLVPLVSELVDTLDNHQSMEDRVLYGLTDLVLSEEELDALVQKCQQVVPA